MSVIKSYSVGNGDMFFIQHNSDNFSIIDCKLNEYSATNIISELKDKSVDKTVVRFMCTHPDEDHFGGIELLDEEMPIRNFYVVKNQAVKDDDTTSFKHYCKLRDGEKAFYIQKGCSRKWMNLSDDERGSSGINILWPDIENAYFKAALAACDAGESYNNTSAVIRYKLQNGASVMWLGDLETNFMESIIDSIALEKTTIVFAAHHGRASGKIPDAWLEKLDPQIIVIGEAPSRHLHYYTGYHTLTQNSAGDLTFECEEGKVHIYALEENYSVDFLDNENMTGFSGYIGTLTVETDYTL